MGRIQIFAHRDLYKQSLQGLYMYLLLIGIPIFHLEREKEGRKSILFFGLLLIKIRLAYRYNRPEDKNLRLYFLAIILAPVDLPVAAPPSHEI